MMKLDNPVWRSIAGMRLSVTASGFSVILSILVSLICISCLITGPAFLRVVGALLFIVYIMYIEYMGGKKLVRLAKGSIALNINEDRFVRILTKPWMYPVTIEQLYEAGRSL